MTETKISAIKKERKKWVQIVAPSEFKEAVIGEVFINEPQSMLGRIISANMMMLTGDIKKQSINLTFKTSEMKGAQIATKLIGFEVSLPYLKKTSRRVKSKIEDSFRCTSKDGVAVRIKVVLICKGRAHRSALSDMMRKERGIVSKEIGSKDFIEGVLYILRGDLHKVLKNELKKIFPITTLIIRSAKIGK